MSNLWEIMKFSLDLIEPALNQLEFLEFIDQKKKFYSGEFLKRAIYRYENYWLKLLDNLISQGLNTNKYQPPFDVAWVWHCHLLSPTHYIKDCLDNYGKVFDHSCLSLYQIEMIQEHTKILWENEFGSAFDYNDINSINDGNHFKNYKSKMSYDLYKASERQKHFFYQVSLPHFRDKLYLNHALKRYKKFLYLKQKNKYAFVVPCYAIDIIWHTHQLNPIEYARDTKKILGYVFPHDDSVSDRSPGSKLNVSNENTKDLWLKEYNEAYFFPVAMYRGPAPSLDHFADSKYLIDYSLCSRVTGIFSLKEVKLIEKGYLNDKEEFLFKLTRDKNKKLYESVISRNKSFIKFNRKYFFNSRNPKDLDLYFLIKNKEKFSTKIGNVFKFGHLHDSTNDKLLKPRFYFLKFYAQNEIQKFAIPFFDSYNNELILEMYWNISYSRLSEISFLALKQNFENVHMKSILNEYDMFELNNQNFSNQYGEAIRAKHLINIGENDNREQVLIVEILHIPSIKWSSIKIQLKDKLIATSHLIGLNQLPLNTQIDDLNISLNTKYEKAMLIRNLNGDNVIIKGKWVDLKMPKKRDPANRGNLEVTIIELNSKNSQTIAIAKENARIAPNFNFNFFADNTNTNVDLKTGYIQIDSTDMNNFSIETNLAILLSISVLHVLLEPIIRPKITDPPVNLLSNNAKIVHRPIKTIDYDSYVFFSLIGYNELINSDCFYHHHHHHHMDFNDDIWFDRNNFDSSDVTNSEAGFDLSVFVYNGGRGGVGYVGGGGGGGCGGGGCGGGGCGGGGCGGGG